MVMRGPAGEIRVGYQVAAQFGAWEIAPKIVAGPDVLLFKAAVKSVDQYWFTQEPLALTVRVGRTRWTWEGEAVTVVRDGSTLHADLKGKPRIEAA